MKKQLTHAQQHGQYWTGAGLAARIAEWAGIRGTWLEPSCGSGMLVQALVDAGASRVIAYDVDPRMVSHLQDVTIFHADFLKVITPGLELDGALMNPPSVSGHSIGAMHVAHALTMAPRVVVLHTTALLCGSRNFKLIWSQHTLTRVAHLMKRPSFHGPADDDGGHQGAMKDWSVFEIVAGKREHVTTKVEWWQA